MLGFIQAFAEMRQTGLMDISTTRVGEAMEYALVTTAAGLVVAIPCVVGYNYLVSRVKAIVLEMQTTSSEIVDLLTTPKKPMKFKSTLEPAYSLIDLTPLVDVVFLMLVFFIITADILPLKSLNIEHPDIPRPAPPRTTQILVDGRAKRYQRSGARKRLSTLSHLRIHCCRKLTSAWRKCPMPTRQSC